MPKLVIAGVEKVITQECTLGRHRSCGLQVASEAASRQHAKVFPQDGLWWVEDLGSANGTSLNGSRLSERKRLREGDAIRIGQIEIIFSDDAPQAAGAAETDSFQSPGPAVVPADPPRPAGTDIAGLAGQLIGGYRIERYLGRGMLGAVYRAQQLNLDRPVAFKVFDPARCDRDAGLSKRFLAEAGKVGSVTHDGLVQLHESGEHEGLLWCSMEWVEGDTLEQRLTRDGRLDPETAFLIAERIAEALAAAHARGVIHGDLRPSHVIIMADGRVKLTDVGMMGIFEEAELPAAAPAKDAWYLAPEEAGEGATDPRSDLYSLGCLLFHLLAGRPPYTGADFKGVIQAHAREAIPSLAGNGIRCDVRLADALILGLLAKQPDLRPASMVEVIGELEALRKAPVPSLPAPRATTRSSSSADQPRPPRTAPSMEQQVRAYLVPAGVVLALLVAGIVIVPHLTRRVVPGSDAEPVAEPAAPETPPPATVQPVAPPPAPATKPAPAPATTLADGWRTVQAAVDQAQAKPDWPAAEQALAAFAPTVATQPELAGAVRDRQLQLTTDGDRWYRAQLAALPAPDSATGLAQRLGKLNDLRDAVLAGNRADAQSRYQEALTKLGQSLDAARRQARQLVDAGKVDQLPALATGLAPAFAGTPLVDAQRQFAVLCTEAAVGKPLWQGTWALTHPRLLAATGEQALAAGAILLLVGENAEAKTLLTNDPVLASGAFLRRREALNGRTAAILSFDQADDLRYIEVVTGEPRMAGGALTGAPGEAIVLTCATPVRRSGWEVVVGATLTATQTENQAQFSLGLGDAADAQIRIEGQAIALKVRTATGWETAEIPRPAGPGLRVRIAERGGSVLVSLNEQKVLTAAAAAVAPGAVLRFEAVGLAWGLTDLQVVAGE